ncbi:MAG: hypothetical protein AAFP84_18500 [Actinomycetota bacterium]
MTADDDTMSASPPPSVGPTLLDDAHSFREQSAASVPGRLASLLEDRVRRLHGDADASRPPDDLTAAERAVIEVAEQFVVDVHGLTDDGFERLREYFRDDEIVAVMFHLACLDGFGKLDAVTGLRPTRTPDSHEKTTTS